MPNNLTDVDTYTTPVQVPAGSDDAGLTYLLTAFQALANRTHYLNKLANDVTERTFYLGPQQAHLNSGWSASFVAATASINDAELHLPLDAFLHVGAEIVSVAALVDPGAADMTFYLRSMTYDFATPATPVSASLASAANSSGTAIQVVTLTPASPVAVAADKSYLFSVTANPAASSNNDIVHGFRVVANMKGLY